LQTRAGWPLQVGRSSGGASSGDVVARTACPYSAARLPACALLGTRPR